MITLYPHKEKYSWYNKATVLKDATGKVKAILNKRDKQPRRGQKTIVVNRKEYYLNWSKII